MVAESDEDGTMLASLNCRVAPKLYGTFDSGTSMKRAHFDHDIYVHIYKSLADWAIVLYYVATTMVNEVKEVYAALLLAYNIKNFAAMHLI